ICQRQGGLMIRRPAVFFWLSLQLAVTAAGVLGTMLSPALGVLAGLIFLPANFMVLRKAWQAREQIERNKPLADAIAVAGLALFLVLLLSASLMPALVALLLLATLAMNAQLNRWRKFYVARSEEHTSELQSRENLVCRLLLEKKKKIREMEHDHH